jgi:hypothetical protein
MVWKVCVGILAATWCAGPSIADGPVGPGDVAVDVPVDVPVAMLLGAPITQADLRAAVESGGIDPESIADWGAVLREMVVLALQDRYLDTQGLHATPAELEVFLAILADVDTLMRHECAQSVAAMREQLITPDLPEDERVALEEQVVLLERAARGERWPDAEARAQLAIDAEALRHRLMTETLSKAERARMTEELAYMDLYGGLSEDQARIVFEREESAHQRAMAIEAIERWKFNEALYTVYGGPLLFDDAIPEAIDATRKWLQAHESAGDFAIMDASLVDGFWVYFTQSHPNLMGAPTGREFDAPWKQHQTVGE